MVFLFHKLMYRNYKTSISNHSALTIPDINDVLCLLCNASSRGLGVLYEYRNKKEVPVADYSQSESLQHFKVYLILAINLKSSLSMSTQGTDDLNQFELSSVVMVTYYLGFFI